jgi:hypothetical protein
MSITLKPAILIMVLLGTAVAASSVTAVVIRHTTACAALDGSAASSVPGDARDAASRRARAHPGSAVKGERF